MRLQSSIPALMIALQFAGSAAYAGGKIARSETLWIDIGFGLRTQLTLKDNSQEEDENFQFSLSSLRLYINGQIHQRISFTFNTERNSDGDVKLLDGIVKWRIFKQSELWAGRLLPPSDRSNLSGPYYLGFWDFPFVQKYPSIFAGRDEGLAFWGKLANNRLKYQMGLFEGKGQHGKKKSPLSAARLTYNFWDKETGYYNNSTYFGEKDILAIGAAILQQNHHSVTGGDYLGWNLDFLCEKNMTGHGTLTLEGASYHYEVKDPGSTSREKALFALAGYLFPEKAGMRMQLTIRYQKSDEVNEPKRLEGALNFIIRAHNLRFSTVYAREKSLALESLSILTFGLQLQF